MAAGAHGCVCTGMPPVARSLAPCSWGAAGRMRPMCWHLRRTRGGRPPGHDETTPALASVVNRRVDSACHRLDRSVAWGMGEHDMDTEPNGRAVWSRRGDVAARWLGCSCPICSPTPNILSSCILSHRRLTVLRPLHGTRRLPPLPVTKELPVSVSPCAPYVEADNRTPSGLDSGPFFIPLVFSLSVFSLCLPSNTPSSSVPSLRRC